MAGVAALDDEAVPDAQRLVRRLGAEVRVGVDARPGEPLLEVRDAFEAGRAGGARDGLRRRRGHMGRRDSLGGLRSRCRRVELLGLAGTELGRRPCRRAGRLDALPIRDVPTFVIVACVACPWDLGDAAETDVAMLPATRAATAPSVRARARACERDKPWMAMGSGLLPRGSSRSSRRLTVERAPKRSTMSPTAHGGLARLRGDGAPMRIPALQRIAGRRRRSAARQLARLRASLRAARSLLAGVGRAIRPPPRTTRRRRTRPPGRAPPPRPACRSRRSSGRRGRARGSRRPDRRGDRRRRDGGSGPRPGTVAPVGASPATNEARSTSNGRRLEVLAPSELDRVRQRVDAAHVARRARARRRAPAAGRPCTPARRGARPPARRRRRAIGPASRRQPARSRSASR